MGVYLVILLLLSSHLCLSRFSITNVHLVFLSGCWGLKSGLCAYCVSNLSTQPSPWSLSENYCSVEGILSRLNISLKTQLKWNPSKFPPYWFRTYLLFRAGRLQRVGYLRWLPNKIGGRNKGQRTRGRDWKWEHEIYKSMYVYCPNSIPHIKITPRSQHAKWGKFLVRTVQEMSLKIYLK